MKKLDKLLELIARRGHHISEVNEALTNYFYDSHHTPVEELRAASIQRVEVLSSTFNIGKIGDLIFSIQFEASAQFTANGRMTNSDFGAFRDRVDRVEEASEDEKDVSLVVVKSFSGIVTLPLECYGPLEGVENLTSLLKNATIEKVRF